MNPILNSEIVRLNYRAPDWPLFQRDMNQALQDLPHPKKYTSVRLFNAGFDKLMSTINSIIAKHVPLTKPTPHSKRWWTKELAQTRKAMQAIANRPYVRQSNTNNPAHKLYRCQRNDYSEEIRRAKREHWDLWLKEINSTTVWKANRFVNSPAPDGGRTRIPALKVKNVNGNIEEISKQRRKGSSLLQDFLPGGTRCYGNRPKFRISHPDHFVQEHY